MDNFDKYIRVSFRFDPLRYNFFSVRCKDCTKECPVLKFIEGMGLSHSVLSEVPNKKKVITIAPPLSSGIITQYATRIAEYLCTGCKNRHY